MRWSIQHLRAQWKQLSLFAVLTQETPVYGGDAQRYRSPCSLLSPHPHIIKRIIGLGQRLFPCREICLLLQSTESSKSSAGPAKAYWHVQIRAVEEDVSPTPPGACLPTPFPGFAQGVAKLKQ